MSVPKKLVFIAAFTVLSLIPVAGVTNHPTCQSSSNESTVSTESSRFLENGCPENANQDWIIGRAIDCEISPDGKFIGKFIFNGLYEGERYYELFIATTQGGEERRVFAGDFRTLGWEWTEDSRIKIVYNCGTGCRSSKVISVDESISVADYKDGRMNEENGWEVEFFNLINQSL